MANRKKRKTIQRLYQKLDVWLLHYKKGNSCSGRMSFTDNWKTTPDGVTAIEALYHYESFGIKKACSEIALLEKYLQAKATLDLNIKTWAGDRASGELGSIEFKRMLQDLQYPTWVEKAVENQKIKIQRNMNTPTYSSKYFEQALSDGVFYYADLPNADTVDASDLKSYLSNVRAANFSGCDMSLDKLYELLPVMKQLKNLTISDFDIADTSFLAHLKNLVTLDIFGTFIVDYSFLTTLPKLKNLVVSQCTANQLSVIGKLTQLQSLSITHIDEYAQCTDVSFLANLTSLKRLLICDSDITNITAIQNCLMLEYLNISMCPLSDIEVLSELGKLRQLELDRTKVADLTPIKSLPFLMTLDLNSLKINTIDTRPLSQAIALKKLYLNNNSNIINILCLASAKNLDALYVKNSSISTEEKDFLYTHLPRLKIFDGTKATFEYVK